LAAIINGKIHVIINGRISQTVRDIARVAIDHLYEVADAISNYIKIFDLGLP